MNGRWLLLCALSMAALAWGGSRQVITNGAPPTLDSSGQTTSGVLASRVTGCRAIVFSDGGYDVNPTDGGWLATGNPYLGGGSVLYHAYNQASGWSEVGSTFTCTIPATSADGGLQTSFVCPDLESAVSPENGDRFAASLYGLVAHDGGTVTSSALLFQCWGKDLP